MMEKSAIIGRLPYSKPFLFADEILSVDENSICGRFTFDENLDFYNGHFIGNPVTPGVILTETMAQIGLACFGIFLLGNELTDETKIAMTSTEVEFLKPVFPGETVTVTSEKVYFRFGKLKCRVSMQNANNKEVCRGTIAGILQI